MQKEVTAKRSLVDTLQSKVRWLEDQIDTLIKVGIMHRSLTMILKIEVKLTMYEKSGVPWCYFGDILCKTGVPTPEAGEEDSKYGVNEKSGVYY